MRFRHTFITTAVSAAALSALALGAAACSDDGGSEEDEAAIQAVVDNVNQAQLNGDVDLFLAQFTEQGLQEVFFTTPDQVRENPEEITIESEDEFVSIEGDIEFDGDTAEATIVEPQEEGSAFVSPFLIEFTKEGDVWKVNGGGAGNAEEPDNASTVSLGLSEFAFDMDESELEAGAPVLFEAENTGDQPHHFVLFKLDEGVVLEDALQEEDPEGVHELGGSAPFHPGNEANVAFTANLEAGRYALLCFFPDISKENPEEQMPHFLLGMVKEFEVN